MALFVDADSNWWREKININILGTMYSTQSVLQNMIENRYGRIVNIGSVTGIWGSYGMSDYSMTKGAVHAFSFALAKEVGALGITVNVVSPGNIRSADNDKNLPDLSYMGRSGSSEECANVVCFLASEGASYVTGQNYVVDGGRKRL